MPAIATTINQASKIYLAGYHPGEDGVNPSFLNLSKAKKVKKTETTEPNAKLIWTYRGDFTVVVGTKSDKHGHPSLTRAGGKYDGGVYDAGYLRFTKNGDIECYKHSGRFRRFRREDELSPLATQCIEIQTAKLMMKAYGSQSVTFIDYTGNDDGLKAFKNEQRAESESRSYSAWFIQQVDKLGKNVTLEALEALKVKEVENRSLVTVSRSSIFGSRNKVAPVRTSLSVDLSAETSTNRQGATSSSHQRSASDPIANFSKFFKNIFSNSPKSRVINVAPRTSLTPN